MDKKRIRDLLDVGFDVAVDLVLVAAHILEPHRLVHPDRFRAGGQLIELQDHRAYPLYS
ncbi:MAG: hypothetical protein P8181_07275 [bacterium]